MKKLCVLACLLGITCCLSALTPRSQTFTYDSYDITAFSPESVQPGDAIFIRLVCKTQNKQLLKQHKKTPLPPSSGTLQLFASDQNTKGKTGNVLKKASFYSVKTDSNDSFISSTLLSGVPLSTYTKTGTYVAEVTATIWGQGEVTLSIPVTVVDKEFVSETIQLNASNTAIKTDTSKTRTDQIDRLNKILDTRNPTAVYQEGPFAPPTPATRRTSFFGDRRVYAYNNGKSSTSLHYGIDYGVPTGTKVAACGSGKVVMAENRISTGWSVCIEHLPGLYSLYYHMSTLNVRVGQMVSKGDLLGESGATGLATGPHLHWEVRLNMEAVSPDFFTQDFAFARSYIK